MRVKDAVHYLEKLTTIMKRHALISLCVAIGIRLMTDPRIRVQTLDDFFSVGLTRMGEDFC